MAFQRSRDQMKAMFANMKGKVEGTRSTAAAKVSQVHAGLGQTKQNAIMNARQAVDWSIRQAQTVPVERLVTSAIDYPFTWMEGVLANDIERRAANIKRVAAKQLGAYQKAMTESAAKKARGIYDQRAKVVEGDAHASLIREAGKAAMARHLATLTTPGRSLRTEVSAKRMNQAVREWWNSALQEGRQHFRPNLAELQMLLTKVGEPVTPKSQQELERLVTLSYVLGTRPEMMGDNRIGGL